jgi:hypothetical protein
VSLGPTTVYRLDDIRRAQDDLEHDRRVGKLVVVVRGSRSEKIFPPSCRCGRAPFV